MARSRGRVGNASPNKAPNIPKQTGGIGRVRVIRQFNPFAFKTTQAGNPPRAALDFQHPEVTKNQVYQRGHKLLGGRRRAVRRIFRRDPYNLLSANAPAPFNTGATQATMSPVADQFTNNANPAFHPEKSPGSVRVIRQPQAAAGRKNRGKTFAPNRYTLFGGKTLRRR